MMLALGATLSARMEAVELVMANVSLTGLAVTVTGATVTVRVAC